MKEFEIISNGRVMADHVRIAPELEAAIDDLFDSRVFDVDTPATAIPLVDEAKRRLHEEPENYRALLTSSDGMGLRKIRNTLETIHQLLLIYPDATISGPVEPYVPPAS